MPLPNSRTVPDLLDEIADRFPDREALVGDDRRFTYTELRDEVRTFAKGLLALGVSPCDKVAVLMDNRPEWIIADLAICSLGAIMVAVNTWVTSRELKYILHHSDASMLIATDRFLKYDYFAMLAELEPIPLTLPLLRSIVHVGARGYRDSISFKDIGERGRTKSEAVLEAAAQAIDPQDVAYLLYTSGSTSTPKGVQLQHFALIENMWHALFDHPDRRNYDLTCLRSGGTIGSPEQIMRVVNLGARDICNIYGLTETYGNCCVTDASEPLEIRCNTVGRPLPGVDIRIVDTDTGKTLPPGEVGEICVKGYVTIGYFKDEVRTREACDADGFFLTGDLGYLDSAGHLHFRGRPKEMIKTGGINVAPVEIEEILMTHPAVKLAYVVGVPDPQRDEVIAAVIVRRQNETVEEMDLLAHCRGALAAYKIPRLMKFVNETDLPLTVTGKLQKNRLNEFFVGRD